LKDNISDKDKKDWENFINSEERVENKDKEIYKNNTIFEKKIDLHGYTIRDANLAVMKLIKNSYNTNVRKIKIITGKGMRSNNLDNPYKSKDLSILKYSVPHFIQGEKELMKMIDKIDNKSIHNLNEGEFSIFIKKKK
tara:strand:- start:1297 stop:1710 length:414 start_codon:yes stop_codon:yes gene_type:complete